MKKIKTVDAVGHILCHDLTRIVKDEFKGTAFRKGHIIEEKDIELLLNIGKEQLYVWENDENMMHENDAALILANICQNENMTLSEVKEGKIEIFADISGVFKVNTDKLMALNMEDELMIATRHGNYHVKKGDILAGTRVIPLVIDKKKLEKAQEIANGEKIFEILPYKSFKLGIVTTGNEVFSGRIKDTFTPVVRSKFDGFDVSEIGHIICDDNRENITNAINKLRENGANLIICTGGMSVDPDDVTPSAIKNSGANIVSYGAPALPGAMLLLGYFEDNSPILGLPGCVMYANATIFDLILPRILAGEILEKRDLASYGHGGLCLKCDTCSFPNCTFGKGV